jgi:hypothetical protein
MSDAEFRLRAAMEAEYSVELVDYWDSRAMDDVKEVLAELERLRAENGKLSRETEARRIEVGALRSELRDIEMMLDMARGVRDND